MTKKDREKIAAVIAYTRKDLVGDAHAHNAETATDMQEYCHMALIAVATNLAVDIGVADIQRFLRDCGFTVAGYCVINDCKNKVPAGRQFCKRHQPRPAIESQQAG